MNKLPYWFKVSFFALVSLSLLIGGLWLFLGRGRETEINNKSHSYSAVSGIVPHHLLASDLIEEFFKNLADFKPEIIFLLGPDHFNQAPVYLAPFLTNNFGASYLSLKILAKSEAAISSDHSIRNLVPYVKKYLPQAEVVPILVSASAKKPEIEELINSIFSSFDAKNIALITSVDFSHYLPKAVLLFHDAKSINVINRGDSAKIKEIDVDSPMSLYACYLFNKHYGLTQEKFIGHKTNFDYYLNYQTPNSSEEGTSYYSAIYFRPINGLNQELKLESSEILTLLFTGDLMLGRGVAEMIAKNEPDYLFKKIKLLARGVDEIIGNLEGPIVASAPDIPHQSLNFGFPPTALEWLKDFPFSAFSIANNHIGDRGQEGFGETQKYLTEKNIKALGAFNKCDLSALAKIRDRLYILALNLTPPDKSECLKEAVAVLSYFKKENPKNIVIVMPHWGEEYQTKSSSFQKQAGHQLIDAGADLIIGSHPHVIQEIEDYNGRLIFYSLGNFVFDQYFSEDTQKHLALGVVLTDKEWQFYLIPLKSQKSQLEFMNLEETEKELKTLAQKSSLSLQTAILNGIILKERP